MDYKMDTLEKKISSILLTVLPKHSLTINS